MGSVILFHHALGLTPGVEAFAERLRASGHIVSVPDLFDGVTFETLDEGVGHVEAAGMERLLAKGVHYAADHSPDTVYAGFSLGALVAHRLAQTRPGARGALLYHYGDVPMETFGETWPSEVPVQFHISKHDQWRAARVVEDFIAVVRPTAPAQLFEYPGSTHLFTDSSLPEFDPDSTSRVIDRTLELLRSLD